MEDVTAVAVQTSTGLDVGKNIETTLAHLDRLAEGRTRPDLVCLPEMFTFRALGARPTHEVAVRRESGLLDELSARARTLGSYLVAGYLVTDENGRVHNETQVLNRDGKLVGLHRKSHLFDAPGHDESAHVRPGDSLTVVRTDFGTFGIVVCYELRFPEISRTLALAGAEILVVPNSWPGDGTFCGEHDLSILLAAAAVQNQAFVVHANQVGTVGDLDLAGGSCVLDPRGRVVKRAGCGPEIVTAWLDSGLLAETRSRRLVFNHRRPSLYDVAAVQSVSG
ncbi:carbon-nitrogen hydrolase family protein [Pseudonocardia hispaniensis]|uniref:Carbon-nitrogen hydrolase family protein n=1 Tax=Pseudonocardia hispaniensis TaxID=904933 RepID=A0ABW1IWY8_9PSEU